MSLTRQTQKVFCSNANANQLAVFGTMKTGTPVYSTSLATLQSQEYTQGWADAILNDKAPFLEEMNAVQYGLSYQIAYILQEGAFVYDANTNYSNTTIVKVIDSNGLSLYRSLVDNNLGHSLSDTNYWELIPIANILPQIANKANIDLANIVPAQSAKDLIMSWLAPNYTSATSVSFSSGDAVDFNGWLGVDAKFSATNKIEKFCINGIPVFVGRGGTDGGIVDACGGVVLVSENDVITWELTYGTSLNTVTFYKIPFIGG